MSVGSQQFTAVRPGQLWERFADKTRWRVASVSRGGEKVSVIPVPLDEARPWASETLPVEVLRRDYTLRPEATT